MGGTGARARRKAGVSEMETPEQMPIATKMKHTGFRVALIVAVVVLSGLLVLLFTVRQPFEAEFLSEDPASVVRPVVHSFRIVKKYRHDPKAFTQGLLWLNGSLFESTGLYGQSGVREVRLETGSIVRQSMNPGKEDFGEGLAHIGHGRLMQLLWQTGRGYRWQVVSGEDGNLGLRPPHFQTPLKDGWGLEFDGTSLIATDSGSKLHFLDAQTLELQRSILVHDNGSRVEMLNELEFVEGELWANIFGNECLARIQPSTGEVTGWVLLQGIIDRRVEEARARKKGREAPDVMNGIAYDSDAKRLFVTGKRWPALFEIALTEAQGVSVEQARRMCIPTRHVFTGERIG